jgi:hypothetical protein
MVYWAACRLQPYRTALALHFLNLQGYEVYCPRLREPRELRGRRVEVLLPLFPGYTFLQVVTGWWQARWAPGTCGLVMDGTTPAKVPAVSAPMLASMGGLWIRVIRSIGCGEAGRAEIQRKPSTDPASGTRLKLNGDGAPNPSDAL